MVKKMVTSVVLVGSLAIGSAGGASADPKPSCTNAPAVIARLQAAESQLGSVLASLQAKAAGGRHEARRLHREIEFLTRVEARLASRVTELQARCPGATTGGGTTTTTGGGTTGAS